MFLSHTFFLTLLSSPSPNHHIFSIALPDADIHNAIFLILIPRNLVFKKGGRGGGERDIFVKACSVIILDR